MALSLIEVAEAGIQFPLDPFAKRKTLRKQALDKA